MKKIQKHLFHIVDESPWPFFTSIAVFLFLSGFVCYIHRIVFGMLLLLIGLLCLIISIYGWLRDIVRESTFQGKHTLIVQRGLKIGFFLFICTEVVFFFGFFWSFFHSSLSPSIFLGGVWPPVNIMVLNPFGVPLLNTMLLLISGFSITWVHYAIICGNFKEANFGFLFTLILAVFFTILQISEYFTAPFNISDSIYGSVFYSLTGLHGLHVIIGTIFIGICYIRLLQNHFTTSHHLGFVFASWYWHFVDVVWIFLYLFIYIWGNW